MLHTKRGDRVQAEAEALGIARHPGVVELVDVADGALRTRRVDGRPLSQLGPLAPDEVAGVAAAVAAILGDLHELGVVHGGVEGSHVLVAADGRILLCSLGRGGEPGDDVAALGRLVGDLLASASPPSPPRRRAGRVGRGPARLGSLLAPPAGPTLAAIAAEATAPEADRRPDARALAAALHQRIPTARLPPVPAGGPVLPISPPAPVASPGHRRLAGRAGPVVIGSVAVLVLLGAVLNGAGWWPLADRGQGATGPVGTAPSPTAPTASPDTTSAPTAPVAERVWPPAPVVYSDGVLSIDGRRYAVGGPGDAVVAGDWSCTGQRTVALLRPATGDVFAFDRWAAEGDDVEARPVAQVDGASGLRLTEGDGDGCDHLEVERGHGPPVAVDVRSGPADAPAVGGGR